MLRTNPKRLVTVFAAVAILVATAVWSKRQALGERASWRVPDQRVFVPSPKTARLMSCGYNELFADLVWARTTVYYGDRFASERSLVDIDTLLELVNVLDPYFKRPYEWGAYATIFRQSTGDGARRQDQQDTLSSIRVLKRAAKQFPDDHKFAWILGIRYYMDLDSKDPKQKRRDRETGAEWIERAMRLPGAPTNLPALAVSLRTRLGQKEIARQQLREMLLTATDPKVKEELQQRYRSMTTEEDAKAVQDAAQAFFDDWKGQMGFAPPSLYVLVGPKPAPVYDRQAVIESNTFVLAGPLDADAQP